LSGSERAARETIDQHKAVGQTCQPVGDSRSDSIQPPMPKRRLSTRTGRLRAAQLFFGHTKQENGALGRPRRCRTGRHLRAQHASFTARHELRGGSVGQHVERATRKMEGKLSSSLRTAATALRIVFATDVFSSIGSITSRSLAYRSLAAMPRTGMGAGAETAGSGLTSAMSMTATIMATSYS
jgi:hypothetical protein